MVILLAGLQTIPREYYEAAEVDGANAWSRFRHITLPMIMPAIMVVTVLNILYGLRVFDIVYALTNGGPGYATDVLMTGIFRAFSQGQYGLGTAVTSILFVILIVARLFRDPPAATQTDPGINNAPSMMIRELLTNAT